MKKIDILGLGNSIVALINGNVEDYRIYDEIEIYIEETLKYLKREDIYYLIYPVLDIIDIYNENNIFTWGDKETIKTIVKEINSKVREG